MSVVIGSKEGLRRITLYLTIWQNGRKLPPSRSTPHAKGTGMPHQISLTDWETADEAIQHADAAGENPIIVCNVPGVT
jgi:hypothetical protein